MSSLSDLTQEQRPELAHSKPIHLVEVDMGPFTLHWSTRDYCYKYGSSVIHYEGYILDIVGIGEQADFGKLNNPKVTLTLSNEPWRNYSYLSRLNDAVEFQRATISIYDALLLDDDEVFLDIDAGRTLKWKGAVDLLHSIDTKAKTFKLDCCSRLHSQRNRIGLARATSAQFPLADKTVIGQYRNHPIGSLEYVPCKLLKTGATDRLFAAMGTASVSSVIVSGATRVPWATGAGTFQVDAEQFTYTSYSPTTKTFSGVSRARNGTTAAAHDKGASVFQVITEFIYEASSTPVDAITQVDVDGLRQTIDSSVQVYTGMPGNQLAGWENQAVVRFTVKPVVEKQFNVEITSEHAHTTSEGSHGHSFAGAQTVVRTGLSTYSSGNVTSPDYIRDGDEGTAAHLVSSYTYLGEAFLRLTLNNSTNLGAITGIVVKICYSVSTYGSGVASISYGGYSVASFTGGSNLGKGWRSYAISTAAGWGGYLDFRCSGGGSSQSADLYIYEAQVEITCSPVVSNAPASGVSTVRSGSTTANSLAEAVIGKEVAVTMTCVRDDPYCTGLSAGAITGIAGTVIRRPDHVFKYLICSKMGNPLTDIGTSFSVAGAWYAPAGYNLDFLLHDLGSDGQAILQELAKQCRSLFYEWGGKFELTVLPVFDPGTYDFTIESEDVAQGPVFSYQSLSETANKIGVLYRKDYRTVKESGPEVQGPIKSEASDAGFMDYLESGWGPRDLEETIRLTAIRESASAQDYLEWYTLRKRLPEKTIALTLHWRGTLVTPGMVFFYSDSIEGDGAYVVTKYERNERERTIAIEGTFLPPWTADDLLSVAIIEGDAVIVQTHTLTAQGLYSAGIVENVHALTIPEIQSLYSLGVVESLVIVQTHTLTAQGLYSAGQLDNAPLGIAWEFDSVEDLMPTTSTGVMGWWEDDSPDIEPRNTVSGGDNLWEEDGSGDLMPQEA